MTSGSNCRHLKRPETEGVSRSIEPAYQITPAELQHFRDGGRPSGRSRQCVGPMRGGAAACRLTIRLPEDPDGDGRRGYESRKLARELKRRHGWRLHITQTPAARLQGGGADLDRGAHVCVALAEIVA
jgi:hypothetical protein